MQVLYDYQVFSWQRYGGISRYFYELITRVAQTPENAVSVFMGLHVNRYGLERYRPQFSGFFGREHQLSPTLTKAVHLLNPLMFTSFAKRMPVDVYHQTYYDTPPAPSRGQVIVTVYDMIHERLPEHFHPQDATRQRKRQAISRADGIICLSQSAKRDLIELLGVPEEKIAVVHLANSLVTEVKEPPQVKDPYVLFVGQRGGYKNFLAFAKAFASRPSLRRDYQLICFGGGAFTTEEAQALRALGILEKAKVLEGPDTLLANLYRYASVFVYPTLYEGFGLPPLEAMHYGCPVLVSRSSSIPEVVGDAGEYFDPTNCEDMAEKLARLLEDESLRKQLAARGPQRERTFSWDLCAEETQRFYRHVLAR
ncbi:D-inositol 3-phosphate glycosyltransferase [compost metagenome]